MNISPKYSDSRRQWLSTTWRVTLLGISASTPAFFATGAAAAQAPLSAAADSQAALAAVGAARPDAARFLALSRLLTGKADLDPVVGARTFDALNAADPGFGTRFIALEKSLAQAQPGDMASFDDSPAGRTPALRATAVEIVSAWYLGKVGSGHDTRVVAYYDALMYRPTAGITTVPSYSIGGFGYWASAPG